MAQFGELNELGIRARGVSIETRPSAQVVAPHDGHVVFAGTFRSYGRLLIIAHGEEYHTLLAGLDQIDCEVGQWVHAGDPVGQMSDHEKKPVLYVEVRQEGEPVNPLAWLAEGAWLSEDDDKVSG
jgi:septal ring factor EnvC (AmiA/AmiB activator)